MPAVIAATETTAQMVRGSENHQAVRIEIKIARHNG
jgi:hypothetical protein